MGKLRRGCVSAVIVLLVSLGLTAFAQDSETAPEGAGIEQSVIVAPVVVDGTVLFTVRGVSALPAAKRAARVAKNIVQAARDPAIDPAAIQAVEAGGMTAIMAGDSRLTAVVDRYHVHTSTRIGWVGPI